MQFAKVNMTTLPEAAFYMVGTIEEAIEKAEENGTRSCCLMSEEFKVRNCKS